MKNKENLMKVTYIYHSGFAIELEHCVLLFDYYLGELPQWDKNKTIYAFVSHKHKDHFSLKIFDLVSRYDNVYFLLGSDVKLSEKYLERNHISSSVKNRITNIGKRKEILLHDLKIKTLRSTDAGVAFIVEAEGKVIYHAGDLNWWHWEGETLLYNQDMEKKYKKEIDDIKDISFDVAFVPLDPRLEKAYGFGMDYFLENIQVKWVFAMHMWEEYSYIDKYKQTTIGSRYSNKIINISKPGQEITLWNI